MNGSAEVITWSADNWQWLITFILLMTSVGLGISSYIFQRRTAIRESLEQLDHEILTHELKLLPLIHSFDFFPPNRGVVLQIHLRRPASQGAGSNVSILENFRTKLGVNDVNLDGMERRLVDQDSVRSVKITNPGIYIECSTLNSIRIREIAILSMTIIGEGYEGIY